jgi:transposase-like protein
MARTGHDITNPIYHDEDAARAHLETVLWPNGPFCPRCGVMSDRITKLQGKSTRPGVYKCKDCRKPFSVTVGTVMERSHIPLAKWVLAATLMASSKKGMSAHQLHRMMDVSYEAAWFLFHRLREAAHDPAPLPLGGPDNPTRRTETSKLNRDGWWMAIREWDIYDYAVIAGIILSCLGFLFALFPQSRTGGILFPIGAALMAFAAYGSNEGDAYTD